MARKMVTWAVELSKYDFQYQSRQALKSQCLADFIAKMKLAKDKKKLEELPWVLFVDGSSSEI